MIDEKKVKLMTKATIAMKGSRREKIIQENFWYEDFISLELWKAWIGITLAYMLGAVVWVASYIEEWTVEYGFSDLLDLGFTALRYYLYVVVVGLLICFLVHTLMYIHMKKKQKIAAGYLEDIEEINSDNNNIIWRNNK